MDDKQHDKHSHNVIQTKQQRLFVFIRIDTKSSFAALKPMFIMFYLSYSWLLKLDRKWNGVCFVVRNISYDVPWQQHIQAFTLNVYNAFSFDMKYVLKSVTSKVDAWNGNSIYDLLNFYMTRIYHVIRYVRRSLNCIYYWHFGRWEH